MGMKKIINKFFIILVVFFVSLIFFNVSISLKAASNSELNYGSEKIYTDVSINEEFDDDSVLVVMKKEISEVNKEYSMDFFGDFPKESIVDLTYIPSGVTEDTNINIEGFTQILQIKLPIHSKQNVLDVIQILQNIDEILWVGPNHIESAAKQPISANTPTSGVHRYPDLWGLHDSVGIQVEQAWDFTTGNDNIRVGVIDSGMYNHSDISGNRSTEGGDFVNMLDEDNNIPGPLRADPDGHGTHVSGTIGATGTNPNGVTGVAWNVELVPLQVSYWSSYYSDWLWDIAAVARAITWAMDNGIDIINYSGGGTNDNPARRSAMNNFNGLFVVAAGNGGRDGIGDNNDTNRYYPSDYSRGQEFSDRVISVGAYQRVIGTTTNNVVRCNFSNFGEQSVSIFAPGSNILSTSPTSISSTGYASWGGTSMATPHVTGTAVLLWDILENSGHDLTQQEIAEQIKIAIISSAVTTDAGTPLNNLSVSNGRLNAYNAVKYVLEHFSNIEYTLGNYSSSINTNKTIVSGDSYFNNKNGFYKLNVTYAKNYEFNISSNQNLNVILYDEDFSEVSYTDFDSSNNKTHFIQNLSVGTYYLRTQYENEEASGTINTKINSRTTTYLNYGTNNILLNTYNDIVDYYYINERGAGFFKFTVEGTKTDGTTVSLPANALKIYNDSGKLTPMDKFTVTGVSNAAQNKLGENSIITYLPRNGYFYLDIDVSSTDLKSLTINISKVESQEIDLFDLNEDENSTISVLNNSSKGDYIKTLNIEQAGKFTISYNYNGGLTDSFLFILAKQNYTSSTNQYSLTTLVVQLMDGTNDSFTYTGNLEAGKYYIGYLNKNDNSSVVSNFVRYVTLSGEEVLVTDPDQGTLCGSQINIIERNHSNKSYRQTFITVGFTRLIYPNYNYGISPSRLDYDWYSSNTSIATVTNYGTVLGKSAGTVKIMAVLKSDPSKVFVKEFTIINDIGSGIVEIHSTYTVKYSRDVVNGKFHFDMEKINCPYPWLQDYTWSLNNNCHGNSIGASMDNWGDITINGTGCFTLTGTYNVNSRYRVIIHFVIEP